MKTSTKMQVIISQIAEKHGLDLTARRAYLRLDLPGFDRLVIEKVSNLVKIAHYYEPVGPGRQPARLMADPEIIFFVGDSGWIPFEVQQVIGGRRTYAILATDLQSLALTDPARQASLANFSETWAQNIEAQRWLEQGERPHDPCEADTSKAPDLETLMEWEAASGCEAVDGCWVESDGTCPHGCKSWMLVMGLI